MTFELYFLIYDLDSEAATETIFENIFSFLPEASFSVFFQGALCVFTEQMPIFQEGLSVRRTDTHF